MNPDYASAARRMAEAIEAFVSIKELDDPKWSRFKGTPEFFDLIVARRHYLDELEGRRTRVSLANGKQARQSETNRRRVAGPDHQALLVAARKVC